MVAFLFYESTTPVPTTFPDAEKANFEVVDAITVKNV
jgi:hypothetical protein